MITLFENFMIAIDQELQNRCGLTSDDLVDYHYHDNFDDGIGVMDTVHEVLEDAGFCPPSLD